MAELLLQAFNKTVERLLAFLSSLIDTGIFQYLHEYQTDLLLYDTVDVLSSDGICLLYTSSRRDIIFLPMISMTGNS